MILTTDQQDMFWEDGYIFLPELISSKILSTLREGVEDLINISRSRVNSDVDFDLTINHNSENPSCNRIKETYRLHEAFNKLLHSDIILDTAAQLIGENIYFEDMPLNLKPPGEQSSIEWHQDWAFMPYTNGKIITVLVFLCDCDENNGTIKYIPQSHKYPEIISHHHEEQFCGAINPNNNSILWGKAISINGKAGGVCIHHARTIHGSGPNKSNSIRPIQAIGLCAGDSWPLLSIGPNTEVELKKKVVKGNLLPIVLENIPVRLPFPPVCKAGSLFELQKTVYGRSFDE